MNPADQLGGIMQSVPRLFFATAALFVLVGMSWGIHMAASGDHTLAPAHAHLNLIGFVVMSVYGTYYALVPKAAASKLCLFHYGLTVVTILVFVPGIVIAISGESEILAIIGSLLALLSMLVFFVTILRHRAA